MIDLQYIPHFYQSYVRWIDDPNVISLLNDNKSETLDLLKNISLEKQNYSYGIRKWSIKQVVQHLIDVERVFCYRALRFSRNDSTDLPGFDQQDFIAEAKLENVEFDGLISEWESVRDSSIHFYTNLYKPHLRRIGRCSGVEFSVESIAYIIVGHTRHHIHNIKEKYL